MRFQWVSLSGDIGSLFVENGRIALRLSEDPNEDEDDDAEPVSVAHRLSVATARSFYNALGKALAEVDPKPVTGSIHDTLSACSGPVPEITRVHPSGAGDQSSIDLTTGDGATRIAVQQAHRSLRSISTAELAKLGLKPKPSQPEPHPTGNGGLVTPPLLQRLSAHPGLTALVLERDAFGRSKYGTGLCTNNGRNPLEDARQELGDLLQYVWQAKMEGRDIHPFLDLWSKAYSAIFPHDERDKRICKNMLKYVEAVRDVTTGSKPASRAHADELYTAITQDMLEGDPRMGTVDRLREMMGPAPTLHPRPFWWDFDDGRFVAVDGGHNYLGIKTVDDLLELAPNALDGRESRYPREPRELPSFGFRSEHTGPRTLREYLEAP